MEKPILWIGEDAGYKLQAYKEGGDPKEICGIARIEQTEDGDLWLVDTHLLPLVDATGGSTEFEAEKFSEFIFEKLQEEGEQAALEWGRCYWHTHPGFGPGESGVDTKNAEDWLEASSWMVSLILGKDEWRAYLYVKDPVKMNLTMDLVRCRDVPAEYDDWVKEAAALITAIPKPVTTVVGRGGYYSQGAYVPYSNHWYDSGDDFEMPNDHNDIWKNTGLAGLLEYVQGKIGTDIKSIWYYQDVSLLGLKLQVSDPSITRTKTLTHSEDCIIRTDWRGTEVLRLREIRADGGSIKVEVIHPAGNRLLKKGEEVTIEFDSRKSEMTALNIKAVQKGIIKRKKEGGSNGNNAEAGIGSIATVEDIRAE